MARHFIPSSASASSDRDNSPPPPYSKISPRTSEETPLLGYPIGPKRPSRQYTSIRQYLPILLAMTFFLSIVLFLVFLVYLARFLFSPAPTPTYSVAIIGAGPAGISAAQHLRHLEAARAFRLNITLFESAPVLGGQLALNDSTSGPVFPHNDPEERPITAEDVVGTALVYNNPLFAKTAEATLGYEIGFSELPSQQVGYFSGEGIVSQTTRPYSKTPWTNWLGLIWRYGPSFWRAGNMAKEGDPFGRFTDLPLTSDVTQLMISLGILASVQEHADNALGARGIGGLYVTEVLGPQAQLAHSQPVSDISSLALMLATFQEDTANSYIGGELVDILEQMVSAIGITVQTCTEVFGLKHEMISEHESAWLVEYGASGSSKFQAEAFDKVIIAAPGFDVYQSASIEDVEAVSSLTYRPVHATFFTVTSRLNPDVYGDVDQILFLEEQVGDSPLGEIQELAFLREVVRFQDGEHKIEYLYRSLSEGNITEKILGLDLGVTWLHQARLVNAHPHLYPSSKTTSFKLSDKGLWWTSAIHTIASTVDLSCLAGQIVAEELIKDIMK